jgi:hypothetical protein
MDSIKKQLGFMYNISNKLSEKYTEVQKLFGMEEVTILLCR